MSGTERTTSISFAQAVTLVAGREIKMRLRSKAFLISGAILLIAVLASVVVGGILARDDSGAKVAVVDSAIGATQGLEITDVATLEEAERLVRDGDVEAAIVADSSSPVGLEIVALRRLTRRRDPAAERVADRAVAGGRCEPGAAVPGRVRVRDRVLHVRDHLRVHHRAERRRGEADPHRRAPARRRPRPRPPGGQGRGQQHPGVHADRLDRRPRHGRDAGDGGSRCSSAQLVPAVAWFVVFFAVGFVLLAAMFAASAALVSRLEDVGTVTTPVTLLVMVPYFLVIFFNNNALVLTIMSYVPFSAPVGMPIRLFTGEAAWWEPLVSLAIVILTTAVVVLIGARVYENSLLHIGARVSLRRRCAAEVTPDLSA